MRRIVSLIMSGAAIVACSQDRITGHTQSVGDAHKLAEIATSAVANPTVIGPIAASAQPGSASRDYPFFSTTADLATHGYVEEEFFIQGTANRYTLPDRATASTIDGGHAYRTRIVVRRPASPADFNGTVVMEWQNEYIGFDFDALWLSSSAYLMRSGYAWIGLSNQAIGVQLSPFSLRAWSPTRYGTLDVTDGGTFTQDELSYDIFSQAAQALREPQDVDPMGGLHVERIVAFGVSTGADYLARYYNSIQPLAGVIDGFLLASGGGLLRTDLSTPVLKAYSETDLFGTDTPQAPLRQPSSDRLVRWEVAGASHVPFQVMQEFLPLRVRDLGPWSPPMCSQPSLSRIPLPYVFNAALDHMVDWVKRGIAPPLAPDIEVDLATATIARDADGNALGGIRLSQHAVPTATNTGVNGPVTKPWCLVMGSHVPFATQRLHELYPTHQDYVSKVIEATHAAERAGYILGHDAAETIRAATRSDIGRR